MSTTKQCTKCKIIKNLSEYPKDKRICRHCRAIYKRHYTKTKEGLIYSIYNAQKSVSKKRGHRLPEYTRIELMDWLFSQVLFHELYSEWKASGHKRRLRPSVDRKCDNVHYCMNNIQLMTWEENSEKAHKDQKTGELFSGKDLIPIQQALVDGTVINHFVSIREASRQTGIQEPNISRCSRGKRKTAGGFIWIKAN